MNHHDLVGSTYAGVVDGGATIADGSRVVLYVWYVKYQLIPQ